MSKSRLASSLVLYLKKAYNSLYLAPSVVLIALLFITYWSWRASQTTLSRDTEMAATSQIDQKQSKLLQRMSSYEQVLIGGAGLVRGSEDVTKDDWRDYVSTFDTAKRYPDLQNVGYAKAFSAAELPEVVSKMQAQGTDFHISPESPRDFYTAILYSDPETIPSPVGIDMFTEPKRMEIMAKARDTGLARITTPLKSLVPDTLEPVIYMYVAQYHNGTKLDTTTQRQKGLEGYVYAQLRSRDAFGTFFNSDNVNDSAFELSAKEGTGNWLNLSKTNSYDQLMHSHGTMHMERVIDIYGQAWKLSYSFRPRDLLSSTRRDMPLWTLLFGLLFASLVAELVFLLVKSRANELVNLKDEAIDLAKDELLSLASHQLRTPATTVKQYLGMVLQGFAGDVAPTQLNLLEKAYAGNERQLYIINEMLHIAKIDSGRMVLARRTTNINKLLEDISQETRGNETFQHTLTLKIPKKPVLLNVDEHMLRMAVENIVSNAVKYTLADGKINITLSRRRGDVRIEVTDTGIGIDKRDMERLYKLFTRLDNPLTQNISGTGVGLYLAKHLIELHDGTLTVTSKPGVGSTFTITLPTPIKE